MLLNAANCQGYRLYHFWVIKGKTTGGVKLPPIPPRLRLKRLLHHEVPLLVWVGCRNHKLALCLKHLMVEYTNINKAGATLLAFWKYFYYCPLALNLKEAADAFEQHVIMPVCPSVTRWTAHGRACEAVYDGYQHCIELKAGARSNGPICCPVRRRILDHITFA